MSLSTDKIISAAAASVLESLGASVPMQRPLLHLDVGSGEGNLIAYLRKVVKLQSEAIDYTDQLMKIDDVNVHVVDLNSGLLPFPDSTFDLVTCTEVIEHLENYRHGIREIHRVLKPGGIAVLSTPNILNITSRWRNLVFGFPNLFGPLPLTLTEHYSTDGHITFIPYFYLAQSLISSGFTRLKPSTDKIQRTGILLLMFLWPFIFAFGKMAKRREKRRYRTISFENEEYVDQQSTLKILLGRTIIVSAQKQ